MRDAPPGRSDFALGVAVVVGGAVTAIASRLTGSPFQAFNTEGLAVLAAGLALAACGVAMLAWKNGRARGFAATVCVVLAVIPLGLTAHLRLYGRAGPVLGAGGLMAILGSAAAFAGAAIFVARRANVPRGPDRTLLTATVGAAVAAAAAFLPWIVVGQGLRQSGFAIENGIGKLTLTLCAGAAVAIGAHALVRVRRVGTGLALVGAGAAGVAVVAATHVGVIVRDGVGLGIYLVIGGGVVALAAVASPVLRSLGLAEPSPAGWVTGLFLGFGVLGLVLGFALQDRVRDLGASVFVIRLSTMALLVTGAGLAARQTWAWLLGFPVALAGIANGAVVAITQRGRGFGLLGVVLYANALKALWKSRGQMSSVPAPAPPEDERAEPPAAVPPPSPAMPPAPSAVAPAPLVHPEPAATTAPAQLAELPEDRTWQSDPALREVLDPLNRRDHAAAAAAAERLVGRFPDLDLIYSWWGKTLLELGDVTRAREVLRVGIARSRRKFLLCERLGEAAWKAGDLDDAVRWWAESIRGQESLPGTGEVGPYLYLNAVAEGMGLPSVASTFLERVDRMRAGQIRLEPPVAADLRALAARSGSAAVTATLRELHDRYVAAAPSAPPPAPARAATAPGVAPPPPGRRPSRRLVLMVGGAVLLVGAGVVLGVTLFDGGDDVAAPRARSAVPSVTEPAFEPEGEVVVPDDVPEEDFQGCLAGQGADLGTPEPMAGGGTSTPVTFADGTESVLHEFPGEADADAWAEGRMNNPVPGYTFRAVNVVFAFTSEPPPPVDQAMINCTALLFP